MALDDLIRTSGVLNDPPATGEDLLGTVLDATDGTLTIESDALDGAQRQHVARGHWPDAEPGDPVLLRILAEGLWAIGWEPA